jgi:WD40 repeat protein
VVAGGLVAGAIYWLNRDKSPPPTEVASAHAKLTVPVQTRDNLERKGVDSGAKADRASKKPDQPKNVEPDPMKAVTKTLEGDPKKPNSDVAKVEAPKFEPKATPAEFEEPIAFHGHQGTVVGTAVSRDASRILSVSNDRTVRLTSISARTGAVLHRLKSEGVAVALCAGDKVAVFADGGEVVVLDLVKKEVKSTFANPRGGIECLAAAPDGSFVLTGATDGCVRRWSIRASKLENTLDIDEKAAITMLSITTDGSLVAVGLADGRVAVWDLKQLKELKRWKAHAGRVTALAITADGERVASGGDDGTLSVWNAQNGQRLQRLAGHKGAVLAMAWCNVGSRLITSGADRKVCLWDGSNGRQLSWSPKINDRAFCVACDARDRFVVAGQSEGTVQLLPLPRQPEPLPQPRPVDAKD